MRLARILGAIGRGLISAGVIVLLFVAYQLWGTGIQNAAAQDSLGNELEESFGIDVDAETDTESLREAALASQEAVQAGQVIASEVLETTEEETAERTASEAGDDGPSSDGDPGATLVSADLSDDLRTAILAKLYPDAGEAFARIVIPDINVDQIVVEGVSVEDLRKGPGHYRTTPNPGQAGNAAIAGHRTTYGAPFHRIDELDEGASIFVTTAQGTFEYLVRGFTRDGESTRGHFIVAPSQTEVLEQGDENLLTLTACHPKYSARQRIIVQAVLVGEPAPTISRDEAVDLAPLTIEAGASDERAAESDAVDGDADRDDAAELGEDVVMGDDVAADDDDTVDSEGNPIDGDESASTGAADAEDADAAETGPNTGGADTGDAAETGAATGDADDTGADTGDADADEAGAVSAASDDGDDGEVTQVALDTSADGDASLVSSQTPLGDPNDFGEGLNGDRSKIKPAIMWGIAGGAIWLAAWFIGQRVNRRWTLYAIGLVPFGFVLWSTFVNIDQALPSY